MKEAVTHEDILARLASGDGKFDAIAAELAALRQEHGAFRSSQETMAVALAANTEAVTKLAEVQEAWVAVKGTGNFIIWWGKVAAGATVILASLLSIIKFELWRALAERGQ